jgi:hypothetical protein
MAAMENPEHIRAHMIDASEFPELSEHYGVSSVPLTVIDGKQQVTFVGKYPEARFVQELLKAVE